MKMSVKFVMYNQYMPIRNVKLKKKMGLYTYYSAFKI